MSVTENSPAASAAPSFRFQDVDCWAVTSPEPNLPTIKFRWSIRNFLQIYNTTHKITSPCFEGQFEGKGGIGNKWQMRLRKQLGTRTGREFLSAHVYLAAVNGKNPLRPEIIHARFQISILEANGSVFRTTGEDSQYQVFKERSGWGYNNLCLVDHFRTIPERLLPDGNFMITCEIQIQKPNITVDGLGGVRNEAQNNQSKSMSRLANDFRNLLRGGVGSDFMIYVVDKDGTTKMKFAVHKVVLAARSDVFRAMFTFSQNKEKYIAIKDFDCKVVGGMLEYMYTGLVDGKLVREKAQDLLQIADYYGLEELRHCCETIIAGNLEVENAMDCLVFADKFNCEWLKKTTMYFVSCHRKDVMKTAGFKKVSEMQPRLIVDLYLG